MTIFLQAQKPSQLKQLQTLHPFIWQNNYSLPIFNFIHWLVHFVHI